MTFLQSKPSLLAILGIFLALAACSGMTPGGGSPGEVGGPSAIGNSLDGGNALDGNGGGLGSHSAGGQAVPSTQQSTDSIGGGCGISFQVKVKVLHQGSEQFCTASAARVRPETTLPNEGGVMAPSEDYSSPRATFHFTFQGSISPITLSKSQNAACVAGRWETVEPIFFRYLCSSSNNYQVRAQASWMPEDRLFTSNLFQGAPLREPGNYSPIPVEVTIDLGYDLNPHYELPEDSVNVIY